MSTANLDVADMKAALAGGLVREDVMDKIFDISRIPLPFSDLIGSTNDVTNSFKEWTLDALAAPDITNAVVDGSDASGNDTSLGTRVGNRCQISDKVVRVSFRAEDVTKIGRAKELARQLTRKQQELRRDVEAICLINQASVEDNGNATAGKVGTLPSWLTTTHINGTAGGFNTTTKLTVARTVTAKSALTEAKIKTALQSIYNAGGDATHLMTVPDVISRISEYLFSTSARIATLKSEVMQSAEKAKAIAAINVYAGDFGTLMFVPNRLQQKHADSTGAELDAADVFILDPQYLQLGYLHGYRTETLAKTGLAENRQMSVDWTLIVGNESAQGMIGDIDFTAAMTA